MTFDFLNPTGFNGSIFGSLKSNTFIITHLKLATQSLQQLVRSDSKSLFYFGMGLNDNEIIVDDIEDRRNNHVSPNIVRKRLISGIKKKDINFVFVMKDLDSLFLSSFKQTINRICTEENMAIYNHYNNTNLSKDEFQYIKLESDSIHLYGEFFNQLFQLMPNYYYEDHLYPRFSKNLSLSKILHKKYDFDNFRLVDIKNLSKFMNSEYKTKLERLHKTPVIQRENIKNMIREGYPNLKSSNNDFNEIIIKNLHYLYNLEKVSKLLLEKNYEYIKVLDDKVDKKDN